MPEVPYLADAGARGRERVTTRLLEEIATAIAKDGFWAISEEWRMSTYVTERIEVVENSGRRWFEVTVQCDTEMRCHAPTLERAVEYMAVFERLIMDLFWTLGWPSWPGYRRYDPAPGETLP